MKIYMGIESGKEHERLLDKIGCKRRFLSFYELNKTVPREDYLKDMKEKGKGSYVDLDVSHEKNIDAFRDFVLPEQPKTMLLITEQSVFANLEPKNQEKIQSIIEAIVKSLVIIEGLKGEENLEMFKIGERLSKAKKIIPHGKYDKWVKETFGNKGFSTLKDYKKLYERLYPYHEIFKLPNADFIRFLASKKDISKNMLTLISDNVEYLKRPHLITIQDKYKSFPGKIDHTELIRVINEQIEQGKVDLDNDAGHNQKKSRREQNFSWINEILERVKITISNADLKGYNPADLDEAVRLVHLIEHLSEKLEDLQIKQEGLMFRKLLQKKVKEREEGAPAT